ncbi:MAG: 1-(5-phosphoribosyl)-5-amino-4-imidazole-carboxylate carboxylase [Firmicutes bacterium]|nr:1-(5-phosphoribosyl)-5-amino-4-imidazole-carboxylate carboxylase [Bacillota bacterium]
MNSPVRKILEGVKNGEITVDEALLEIKKEPYDDLGFAKVDLHRGIRQGAAEVIYGAGKTPDQIKAIVASMKAHGQKTILITRLSKEAADEVAKEYPMDYNALARTGIIGTLPKPDGIGMVVVATGGTSDVPVAEEAAITAEAHGSEVVRLYDVGVAGLHRLLDHMDEIMNASIHIFIYSK